MFWSTLGSFPSSVSSPFSLFCRRFKFSICSSNYICFSFMSFLITFFSLSPHFAEPSRFSYFLPASKQCCSHGFPFSFCRWSVDGKRWTQHERITILRHNSQDDLVGIGYVSYCSRLALPWKRVLVSSFDNVNRVYCTGQISSVHAVQKKRSVVTRLAILTWYFSLYLSKDRLPERFVKSERIDRVHNLTTVLVSCASQIKAAVGLTKYIYFLFADVVWTTAGCPGILLFLSSLDFPRSILTHSDSNFRNQNVPEGAIFFFWNQYSNIVRKKLSN